MYVFAGVVGNTPCPPLHTWVSPRLHTDTFLDLLCSCVAFQKHTYQFIPAISYCRAWGCFEPVITARNTVSQRMLPCTRHWTHAAESARGVPRGVTATSKGRCICILGGLDSLQQGLPILLPDQPRRRPRRCPEAWAQADGSSAFVECAFCLGSLRPSVHIHRQSRIVTECCETLEPNAVLQGGAGRG